MKFCKFANLFSDYLSKAQGLSENVSNIIDLYHIREIEGGPWEPPPPRLFWVNQTSALIGLTIISKYSDIF